MLCVCALAQHEGTLNNIVIVFKAARSYDYK